jgi:hypothetical protein
MSGGDVQQNHEQVNDELLGIDEDIDCAADAHGGDTVTSGNLDTQVRLRQGIQVEPACCHGGDGVCGARINEGCDRVILHTDVQLHCVGRGEARDGIQRNEWVFLCLGVGCL